MSRYGGSVEPDPERERETSSQRHAEAAWSPYDEAAAQEDAEWRQGRRRRWWATVGGVFLAMCVVGSVVGYMLYDRATRIDRSTPVVVVFQYVNAVFDARDFAQAELFECESSESEKPLRALLTSVEEIERRFDVQVTVSASNFSADIQGRNAVVEASLLIDVPEADGDPSRSNQRWRFELRDEDGWRVCEAAKQEP